MTNTLQYLDYEGLKYYDKKLKSQLGSLIPKDGKDGFSIYVLTEAQANDLVVKLNSVDGLDLDRSILADFLIALINGTTGYEQNDQAKIDAIKIAIATWAKDSSINGSFILDSILFGEDSSTTVYDLGSYQSLKGAAGAAGDLSDSYQEGKDIDIKDIDEDGKLNISVSTDRKFIVRKECGKLKPGDSIGASSSLMDILEAIMGGVINANIETRPNVTFTRSGSAGTSSTKNVEYGTEINCKITATPNLTSSYKEYKDDGETTQIVTVNEHKVATKTEIDESGVIVDEPKTYTATCTITSVTADGKNSDGTFTSLEITQTGATTASTTFTPYLYNFYKKGSLTTSTNEDDDIVIDRTKLTVGSKLVTAKANIDYGTLGSGTDNLLGDKSYFFVPAASTTTCPEGFKYKLLADDTTYYPQKNDKNRITGWYKLGKQDGSGKWLDLVVKIPDANGALRDYHVYKYKSATPFTNPAFLRFGCVANTTSEASNYVEYENSSAFFA